MPKEAVQKEANTFTVNSHGSFTWAITKAVRTNTLAPPERRVQVIGFLVAHGQCLDGALIFAAWQGHDHLVEHILYEHSALVDVNGRVPAHNRNIDGVGNGETCINAAQKVGKTALVRSLLENHGADVNADYKDDMYDGETTLHIACVQGTRGSTNGEISRPGA